MISLFPFYQKSHPERFAKKIEEIFGIDLRSLALLRMGVGLVLFENIFSFARILNEHHTDFGVYPRTVASACARPWDISFHMISGAIEVEWVLLIVQFILAILIFLGCRTRLATFFSWVLLMSIHNRNPLAMQGSDVMLRMLLFWGLFLPWGAYWSFDRQMDPSPKNLPARILSGGTLGYMTQFLMLYIFAGLLKNVPEWLDGTAIYYIMQGDQFISPIGKMMLLLPKQFLICLTHGVRNFEIYGGVLFFAPIFSGPLRMVALFLFSSMQVGFGVAMTLGDFPIIAIVSGLGLIPSWFWDRIPNVFYDRTSDFFSSLSMSLPALKIKELFRASDSPRALGRLASIQSSARSNFIAIFFIFYSLLWNLGGIDAGYRLPTKTDWIGQLFGINQRWNLFSERPLYTKGWFVIPGKLKDGTEIDIFTGKPLSMEKPRYVSLVYKTERWRKYMYTIFWEYYKYYRPYYAAYICREWNSSHPMEKKLVHADVVFMWNDSVTNELKRYEVVECNCQES